MDKTKETQLRLEAAKARLLCVQMVHDAASGHPGGSLSCIDVLTTLYFDIMHIDPKAPHDPDAGAARLLPGGGAENVPPRGRPHVRPR